MLVVAVVPHTSPDLATLLCFQLQSMRVFFPYNFGITATIIVAITAAVIAMFTVPSLPSPSSSWLLHDTWTSSCWQAAWHGVQVQAKGQQSASLVAQPYQAKEHWKRGATYLDVHLYNVAASWCVQLSPFRHDRPIAASIGGGWPRHCSEAQGTTDAKDTPAYA